MEVASLRPRLAGALSNLSSSGDGCRGLPSSLGLLLTATLAPSLLGSPRRCQYLHFTEEKSEGLQGVIPSKRPRDSGSRNGLALAITAEKSTLAGTGLSTHKWLPVGIYCTNEQALSSEVGSWPRRELQAAAAVQETCDQIAREYGGDGHL